MYSIYKMIEREHEVNSYRMMGCGRKVKGYKCVGGVGIQGKGGGEGPGFSSRWITATKTLISSAFPPYKPNRLRKKKKKGRLLKGEGLPDNRVLHAWL
jgi:hypothetical protein